MHGSMSLSLIVRMIFTTFASLPAEASHQHAKPTSEPPIVACSRRPPFVADVVQTTHSLHELVVSEHTLTTSENNVTNLDVDNFVESVSSCRIDKVLERCWSIVRVDHMAGLVVQPANPFRELSSIWDGCRQEDVVDIVGQQDDRLLPDHASF